MHPKLTRVKELLDYDPSTGIFVRRVSRGGISAGSVAGYIRGDGYRYISIDGKSYYGSRLAWFISHCYWPKLREIDHRNLNRSDDRLSNLRRATSAQNNQNRRLMKHNACGFKGVYWDRGRSKWVAQIMIGGKDKWLGYFTTPELAHAAYKRAARKYHGEFARTK
jgi:hypothetical protein